jgi:polyisoprenyl-phosphate glycosyltransferase
MVELSVVVPVYGCEGCLRALHERLTNVLRATFETWEVVYVDDRSRDGGWDVLTELAADDPAVHAVRLSRNFGQHAAITAGLAECRGRHAVVMDCDLQDPPEEIPRLWDKAREGYEVVLARRRVRHQSPLRKTAGRLYAWLGRRLTGGELHPDYSNMSLISRKVVDSFLSLRDKDRQYLLIVKWLGFDQAEIEIDQPERHAGRSAYTFRDLMRVAVDGLFFQSTVLLRWIVYAGFLVATAGVLLALYALVVYAFGRDLPQWTALPVGILLLTGFAVMSTGVIGLYVGKVFDQVKGRPLYVIDTRVVDGVERAVPELLADRVSDRA